MPILTWEGPADEMPNFCPQGCGGITEDPYGGPCKSCWDAVPSGKRFTWHEECDGPICPDCNSCWCEGGCRCRTCEGKQSWMGDGNA